MIVDPSPEQYSIYILPDSRNEVLKAVGDCTAWCPINRGNFTITVISQLKT